MGAAESKALSDKTPAALYGTSHPVQHENEVRNMLRAEGTLGLAFNQHDTRYPNEQAIKFSQPATYHREMRRQRHRRERAQSEAVNQRPLPSQMFPSSVGDNGYRERQQGIRPRSADGSTQRYSGASETRTSVQERLPTYEEATSEEALVASAVTMNRERLIAHSSEVPVRHVDQETIEYITSHADALTLSTSPSNQPPPQYEHSTPLGTPQTSQPRSADTGRRHPNAHLNRHPVAASNRPVPGAAQGHRQPGRQPAQEAIFIPGRLTGVALRQHDHVLSNNPAAWKPRPLRRSSYSLISEFRAEEDDRRRRERRRRALSLAKEDVRERRMRREQRHEAARAYSRW